MCTFITTVVSTSDDEAVFAAFKRHGRTAEVSQSRLLEGLLEPGERAYISWGRSGCDCGTPLGALFQRERDHEAEALKARERLKAKGWSESKIARALAESSKAAMRPHPRRPTDVGEWEAIIGDLRAATGARRIGVLLHEDGGASQGPSATRSQLKGVSLREALQTLPEYELRMLPTEP